MNVWLADTNTVSAIFPSYLLRAFQIQPQFTNDIRKATVIIGGRHVTKIPENFPGTLIGVGLERSCMRTLPLAKIVNLLGRKTAECLMGGGGETMIMGDPLLLADWVWQKLTIAAPRVTAPSSLLLVVLQNDNERKYVEHLVDDPETHIMTVLENCDSLLDFFGMVRAAKALITSDPDTMAVALSFNIPCASVSFGSADVFVWKDLFSVLGGQGRNMPVKRMKTVTTAAEILKTWVKIQPFGELKVLKANLLHQLETFFQRKVAGPKPQILLRKQPNPVAAAVTPPTTTNSLSQTQPIIPMNRLNPSWVVVPPLPPVAPPPLPALEQPHSARSRISRAASAASSSEVSSRRHNRSKSLMKKPRKNVISHDTPKSS